ncbi:SAF domain-containing protein [Chloroflexus sp.]|uniref:SAF domain-containing protein n=1 Tax=Chloroflexus sp. TaxID=1904827 RepID=UPI002ACD7A72|nr:SAF domain-containing protein [Chloroflexus sp.]
MNRRYGWLFIGLGAILAMSTGLLVFYLIRQQELRAIEQARQKVQLAAQRSAATIPIPVAARSLEMEALISSADLVLKEFPVDLVPPTAIPSPQELEHQITIAPIGAGEFFTAHSLASATDALISSQIPSGKALFVFLVLDLLAELTLFAPATMSVPIEVDPKRDPIIATGVTLQNIEVFRVIHPTVTNGSETAPVLLLLLVDPTEAILIKQVRE